MPSLPITTPDTCYLFGGECGWDLSLWTSSDDRVRGGRSQSHMSLSPRNDGQDQDAAALTAIFHGNLDTTALGGAGFASQRTVDGFSPLDISRYRSVLLGVARTDGRTYTLVLKDTVLPKRPDGREQSSVSWEFDFQPEKGFTGVVQMPLVDFKPTYRGRPCPDAEGPDWSCVRRVSLMMRSFFGEQEGDFSLSIQSIAVSRASDHRDTVSTQDIAEDKPQQRTVNQGWWSRFYVCLMGRRVP